MDDNDVDEEDDDNDDDDDDNDDNDDQTHFFPVKIGFTSRTQDQNVPFINLYHISKIRDILKKISGVPAASNATCVKFVEKSSFPNSMKKQNRKLTKMRNEND